MATMKLENVISFSTIVGHTATDWEMATDPDFNDIIDASYMDRINLLEWNSPLPDGTGGFHKYLPNVYARARVHYRDPESKITNLASSPEYDENDHVVVSDWFVLSDTQQEQEVTITYPDGSIETTSASALGWTDV